METTRGAGAGGAGRPARCSGETTGRALQNGDWEEEPGLVTKSPRWVFSFQRGFTRRKPKAQGEPTPLRGQPEAGSVCGAVSYVSAASCDLQWLRGQQQTF